MQLSNQAQQIVNLLNASFDTVDEKEQALVTFYVPDLSYDRSVIAEVSSALKQERRMNPDKQ